MSLVKTLVYKNTRMKSFIVLLICCFLSLFSCEKSGENNATIIRNCTSVYLRIDGKEYKVCNQDKLTSYIHGISVTATYRKIKNCNESTNVCLMAYPNDGLIKVMKIK